MNAAGASGADSSFLLPPAASTVAKYVDRPFYFVLYVSIFFFVLLMGLAAWFVIRYRNRKGHKANLHVTHNTTLEVLWSVIPLALVVVIFVMGYQGYLHMTIPPSNALKITVTAQQWSWKFTYDNSYVEVRSADVDPNQRPLVVPVNEPVVLKMTSRDVLHNFYVAAFRIKQDVLPEKYTTLWFTATRTGLFPVYCAEYCGQGHSAMLANILVVTKAEYQQWFASKNKPSGTLPPQEQGKRIFVDKCSSCHAVQSPEKQPTPVIGPRLYRVFGRTETVFIPKTGETKQIQVDEQYIRESIEYPNEKQVVTFNPLMNSFKGTLSGDEINDLIAYIKSLQ